MMSHISTQWATVTKLRMWLAVGRSIIHQVCRHLMGILKPHLHKFCSDWLFNKRQLSKATVKKLNTLVVMGTGITTCLLSLNVLIL